MTWQEAFGHCAKLGGHLAVMNGELEYNFTKALVEKYETTLIYRRAWLDGTEFLMKGHWRCPSIPGPCPYINWGDTEPNSSGTDNCIALYIGPSDRHGMFDYFCGTYRMISVCEFDCD